MIDSVIQRNTPERRWKTSLHEAGHVVASIVLGSKGADAVLIEDGDSWGPGGLAWHSENLAEFDAAIVAACGPAAEILIDTTPIPAEQPTAPTPATYGAVYKDILQREAAKATAIGTKSDARVIAEFAILTVEDAPERWEARALGIHHEARLLVGDNAGIIVNVARKLYADGFIAQADVMSLCLPETDKDSK